MELTAPTTVTIPAGTMASVPDITFRSNMTVELIKHSASDADVIWAARVSSKVEQSLADVDGDAERSAGLINFLMRDRHGTPFEHSTMAFYVIAPIFVFREFMRHRTFSYNEESGRYRKLEPSSTCRDPTASSFRAASRAPMSSPMAARRSTRS